MTFEAVSSYIVLLQYQIMVFIKNLEYKEPEMGHFKLHYLSIQDNRQSLEVIGV